MSVLRNNKSLFSKVFLFLALTLLGAQPVFAGVFEDVFATLSELFSMSETSFAKLALWLIVFTIVFFGGNKAFDVFNKDNERNGRKMSMVIALIMAFGSVVFTPENLLVDVMSMYGGLGLTVLIILFPVLFNIFGYRMTKGASAENSTGKAIVGAVFFLAALISGSYLGEQFSAAFADNGVGYTMNFLHYVNLLIGVVGFFWAVITSFGGIGGIADRVRGNGGDDPSGQRGGRDDNPRTTGPNGPPDAEGDAEPPDFSQEIAEMGDAVNQFVATVSALNNLYNGFHQNGTVDHQVVHQLRTALDTYRQEIALKHRAISSHPNYANITPAQDHQVTIIESRYLNYEQLARTHYNTFVGALP